MDLPDRKQIKDIFEGLLGRDVAIGDGSPVLMDLPKPVVATYVDDAQRLCAVVVMDLALAAHAGAALALIPKGGAEAAVEDKDLPANLYENAAEILNVLAAPLGEASGVHQRLSATFAPTDSVPAHVLACAATLGARDDLSLEIQGYGTGSLSVVGVHAA
jgi:hypothetical protein